jgi:hypothetical protein
MPIRRLVCLVLTLAAATAGRLAGQTCFRGRPLPECRVFAITEIGFGVRLTQEPLDEGLTSADLGFMVNLNEDYALGGTLYAAFEDYTDPGPDARYGIKLRVRRWIEPWLSVDLAPGIMYHNGGTGSAGLAFTSQIGLNFRDWLALTTQLEYLGYQDDRVLAGYAGLRFGSELAVAAALLGAVIAMLAASAPSY